MSEPVALDRETALVGKEREIQKILEHVGFNMALVQEKITQESFMDYTDLLQAKEKDILDLADSFQKRNPTGQRIIFGQRRVAKVKSVLH